MALSKFEQEGLNEALEVYANLQEKIIKNGRLGVNQAEAFKNAQETINQLTEKQEKNVGKQSQQYTDISKTLTDVGKKQRLNNISGKDTFGLQGSVLGTLKKQVIATKNLVAAGKLQPELADKLNDISGDIASGAYDLTGIKQTQLLLDEKIAEAKAAENDELADNLEGYKGVLAAEEKRLEINKTIENAMSATDSLLGGLGSKIKGFLTNPLTAAVALLMTFNSTQSTIADQFGAIGVTEMRSDLAAAQQHMVGIGKEAKDAGIVISGLSNEFDASPVISTTMLFIAGLGKSEKFCTLAPTTCEASSP